MSPLSSSFFKTRPTSTKPVHNFDCQFVFPIFIALVIVCHEIFVPVQVGKVIYPLSNMALILFYDMYDRKLRSNLNKLPLTL